MDEKSDTGNSSRYNPFDTQAPQDLRPYNDPDYNNLTDEEYYAEMEKKVEYYKIHYPDMYEKAMQWLALLDHSEMYKKETNDTSIESPEKLKARDLVKNIKFHGLDESDLSEREISLLDTHQPDWRSHL